MALPPSSLSRVCRSIADFVAAGLDATAHHVRVLIGPPADAVPGESDTEHRLNLFFYRLEPAAFRPDTLPGEPWRLRLHCLITAFGVPEGTTSAGENDLRLLGEVLRLFHERPVLAELDVDGERVRLQVVFQPLGLDDINHLWGTQGDSPYRPSVAYELDLAPILPRERAVGSPLVGAVGQEVHADMAARRAPFTGPAAVPPVTRARVDIEREDWAPRICLVHGGQCVQSLGLALGSPELAAFTPRVWIAGASGSPVTLRWEVWDRSAGWRSAPPEVNASASGPLLDPERAAGQPTTPISLPFTDQPGQAVLHAERTYQRASDGQILTVRSNPVLVSLYEAGP